MRSKIKIVTLKDEFAWNPWFAWRPVRVPIDPKSRDYKIVWLEWVHRRGYVFGDDLQYSYRFPESR